MDPNNLNRGAAQGVPQGLPMRAPTLPTDDSEYRADLDAMNNRLEGMSMMDGPQAQAAASPSADSDPASINTVRGSGPPMNPMGADGMPLNGSLTAPMPMLGGQLPMRAPMPPHDSQYRAHLHALNNRQGMNMMGGSQAQAADPASFNLAGSAGPPTSGPPFPNHALAGGPSPGMPNDPASASTPENSEMKAENSPAIAAVSTPGTEGVNPPTPSQQPAQQVQQVPTMGSSGGELNFERDFAQWFNSAPGMGSLDITSETMGRSAGVSTAQLLGNNGMAPTATNLMNADLFSAEQFGSLTDLGVDPIFDLPGMGPGLVVGGGTGEDLNFERDFAEWLNTQREMGSLNIK